jgi:hypothetical protein
MKTMKIKDLKKLLSDLEDRLGDLGDLEIFIRRVGTPSQPVYDMGIGTYEHGVDEVGEKKEVFYVYLEGDVF